MSVLVALTDNKEGLAALAASTEEARRLETGLVVINLTLRPLEAADLPADARVVDRHGPQDRDPVQAVLDELHNDATIERLVIGVKRRTPVGKALLGSVSQRLLLEAPVPVLAIKA